MIEIRPESQSDEAGIEAVLTAAFPSNLEAALFKLLRNRGKCSVSLVAVDDKQIIGHVLFSPVELHAPDGRLNGLGLAPLAVLPEHQRQGVGTRLVQAGIAACRTLGSGFIVVLGEPEYYGRFGFQRAS